MQSAINYLFLSRRLITYSFIRKCLRTKQEQQPKVDEKGTRKVGSCVRPPLKIHFLIHGQHDTTSTFDLE